jgi:hypothetical protein
LLLRAVSALRYNCRQRVLVVLGVEGVPGPLVVWSVEVVPGPRLSSLKLKQQDKLKG